jgi:hypothetical protein
MIFTISTLKQRRMMKKRISSIIDDDLGHASHLIAKAYDTLRKDPSIAKSDTRVELRKILFSVGQQLELARRYVRILIQP